MPMVFMRRKARQRLGETVKPKTMNTHTHTHTLCERTYAPIITDRNKKEQSVSQSTSQTDESLLSDENIPAMLRGNTDADQDGRVADRQTDGWGNSTDATVLPVNAGALKQGGHTQLHPPSLSMHIS